MYTSYLTRETFENEHDEKMTRKFSYNYQVLKRLFPEVYKLPESEIRSLVHSIYDNPKMGDELLDHLTDVINKRKPEWGEYLNPKPEEPEQSAQPVQDNPLQPVQPKPLNTSSGFEPYKPQKSAFGLNNTGSLGGLNNTNSFAQTKLPDLTKGMDLKHSDMVTGFGINEDKQKEMLGTGFQMPKLPKLPQFPKAPEPQMPKLPQMPEISQALRVQPMPQYPQVQLAYSAYNNQPPMPLVQMQNNKVITPYPVLNKAIAQEGELTDADFANLARRGGLTPLLAPFPIIKDFVSLYNDKKLTDKYKHSYINCVNAQRGLMNALWTENLSGLKEYHDVKSGGNTPKESYEDMDANLTGDFLGIKYPDGDCDELVQRYFKKLW
jgi:hypothetical protein